MRLGSPVYHSSDRIKNMRHNNQSMVWIRVRVVYKKLCNSCCRVLIGIAMRNIMILLQGGYDKDENDMN